jgi:hypothetical protein
MKLSCKSETSGYLMAAPKLNQSRGTSAWRPSGRLRRRTGGPGFSVMRKEREKAEVFLGVTSTTKGTVRWGQVGQGRRAAEEDRGLGRVEPGEIIAWG